ncbi:MAG: MFS transporter, partial [Alphaproteobacteria bacterium]
MTLDRFMDISILKEFWRIYRHPRLWIVLCLGFSSGLPLLLTASTLTLWLDEAGISRAAIGLFAAVATPYSLKFLWSPLMDSLRFPLLCRWLGQRTGWMVATQAGLILSIVAMAFANPADNAYLTALLAVLVAVFSASQDIVIDAYRVEYLEPEQQAAGAAMIVLGYRIGMIASGAGALYLAAYFGWQVSYLVMAALVMVGTVTVLIAGEPPRHRDASALESRDLGSWIKEAVIRPFTDFMQHNRWLAILCFILLYKMADAFMGTMA